MVRPLPEGICKKPLPDGDKTSLLVGHEPRKRWDTAIIENKPYVKPDAPE